jgi:RNA polymerase sigma-70 factor (ECF subfamily)
VVDEVARRLAAARAGSDQMLGQVLEACRGFLLLVAQSELDPALRAKGGASDLVQETFLEAKRDFAQFHGNTDDELRAWLKQLLRNNVANFARRYRSGKRRADREVPLEPGSSFAERAGGIAADGATPSVLAVEREQNEALERALRQLPEDYRRVILLRYQEQRPFEEIARLMNRSPGAVRTLWSRAVRRLRQEMEPAP